MKSREQLLRNYEESLFELLMDDVMELEGLAYAEENERLKNSREFAIPEEIDHRCKKTIIDEFKRNEKSKATRRIKRVFKTALIAALFTTILFTTAYAVVPEVREITKVFITQVYEKYTSIIIGEEHTGETNNVFDNYNVNYVPEGYEIIGSGEDPISEWCLYSNGNDWFDISVTKYEDVMTYNVDSENARYEEIEIGNYDGILIEKNGEFQVVFGDVERNTIISVFTSGLIEETAIKIAEEIKFVG